MGTAGDTSCATGDIMTTWHTYPDLLNKGGRLAESTWKGATAEQAVRATIKCDPEVIILRVCGPSGERVIGLAPGGLG
jgi:hypothetical protein